MKTKSIALGAIVILVGWQALSYAASQDPSPNVISPSFYEDIRFWQWIVSLSALFLSLAPYIQRLIQGSHISLHLLNRVSVVHTLGNPNITMYFAIQNTGGRPVRIKSILLELNKDDKTYRIPAKQYFPNDTDEKLAPFSPFRLMPDLDWSHGVYFFPDFSREDEIQYRTIVSNVRTNIQAKMPTIPPIFPPNTLPMPYEADAQVLQPAMEFFTKHFIWSTGEYVGKIIVQTEPEKATATAKFRFTLFESESNDLRNYSNEYKYGTGIYFFNHEKQPAISVAISDVRYEY